MIGVFTVFISVLKRKWKSGKYILSNVEELAFDIFDVRIFISKVEKWNPAESTIFVTKRSFIYIKVHGVDIMEFQLQTVAKFTINQKWIRIELLIVIDIIYRTLFREQFTQFVCKLKRN